MSLNLIREGSYEPTFLEQRLAAYCQQNQLDLTLEWSSGQYWLHSDQDRERPIGIEIVGELNRHAEYFKRSSLHKELLARAIGIKASFRPQVLDLTAGLLGDTLLFLSFGCQVVAVERNPLIGLLIESALNRADHPALSRLTFKAMEAREILSSGPVPEVIFFDPMFEDPNQKSSPRKEMRIFRKVVGKDADALETFKLARQLNPKRLVIKRPRHSQTIGDPPDVSYAGKATRYDVYFSRTMAESSLIP